MINIVDLPLHCIENKDQENNHYSTSNDTTQDDTACFQKPERSIVPDWMDVYALSIGYIYLILK